MAAQLGSGMPQAWLCRASEVERCVQALRPPVRAAFSCQDRLSQRLAMPRLQTQCPCEKTWSFCKDEQLWGCLWL